MDKPIFTKVREGDRSSAREQNRITDQLAAVSGGVLQHSLRCTTGQYNRPQSLISSGTQFQLLTQAEILLSLQREDLLTGIPARDYYTIELLHETFNFWSATWGTYYGPDDDNFPQSLVKYEDGGVTKIYKCRITHASSTALPPTASSHWEELDTQTQAWIFHYDGDLLETIPWLQPGNKVVVIYFEEKWYILETVTRTEETITNEDSDPEIICSMTWDSEDNRAKAVWS